jgi:hypothetical protein
MDVLDGMAGHPWLVAALVAAAALFVYALVRRLLTLALFLLVVVVGLVAWFRLTGQEVPDDVDRLARGAGRVARGAVEQTGDLLRKGERVLDSSSALADSLRGLDSVSER